MQLNKAPPMVRNLNPTKHSSKYKPISIYTPQIIKYRMHQQTSMDFGCLQTDSPRKVIPDNIVIQVIAFDTQRLTATLFDGNTEKSGMSTL